MLLNFTNFNESNSSLTLFSKLAEKKTHAEFIRTVKNIFKEHGFVLKSAGKGSGSYYLNGIPVYFRTRGSQIYAIIFQIDKPDFPEDVKNVLNDQLVNTNTFFHPEDIMNFYRKFLPAYLSKKLISLTKWGIL